MVCVFGESISLRVSDVCALFLFLFFFLLYILLGLVYVGVIGWLRGLVLGLIFDGRLFRVFRIGSW